MKVVFPAERAARPKGFPRPTLRATPRKAEGFSPNIGVVETSIETFVMEKVRFTIDRRRNKGRALFVQFAFVLQRRRHTITTSRI